MVALSSRSRGRVAHRPIVCVARSFQLEAAPRTRTRPRLHNAWKVQRHFVPSYITLMQRPVDALRAASKDCFLVRRRSSDPPPCFTKPTVNHIEKPILSVLINTFKDSPRQAMQLLSRVRESPVPTEVIVNDDSHGKQSAIWLPLLNGANEFYLASPNLHEVRAYNRLARMARGDFVVFVQGDSCLPTTPLWIGDAIALFRALPALAMLSARVGFDAVLSYQMDSAFRNARTWGSAPYKPIDHAFRRTGNGDIPFRFVPGVDNGPLFYRRDALLEIGGFDESFSCSAGHLSGHYDFDASLQFWIKGWQVGVFYGWTQNGVGGRKTLRNPRLRNERHRNELWNGKRVERLWSTHNATIAERLAESNRRHLVYLPPEQQIALRDASARRIGKHPSKALCAFSGNMTEAASAASLRRRPSRYR